MEANRSPSPAALSPVGDPMTFQRITPLETCLRYLETYFYYDNSNCWGGEELEEANVHGRTGRSLIGDIEEGSSPIRQQYHMGWLKKRLHISCFLRKVRVAVYDFSLRKFVFFFRFAPAVVFFW